MRINEVNYVDKAEKVIKNLAEESKERYRGQVQNCYYLKTEKSSLYDFGYL